MVFFSQFFRFLSENFSDFWPNTSRKCENYLLRVHRNNLWLYIFLKSFEPFWIFYRNLWHGSKNSIYVSRVKISEETVFLFSFSEFFSDFERKFFSDFWPKNFMKFSKLPSTCPEEQFVAWNFFLKFWIVSDFLQKPLAWFSKVYLRVQSKKCGKKKFFFVFFSDFFRFLGENFSDFWPKNFKNLWKLPLRVHRNNLWLYIFLKNFEPFRIFCRNLWHGSQKFIYVSRVKSVEKNSFFLFSFQIFFDFWAKIFHTFRPKNFKKMWKLPSECPEEQFVAWKFFKSFESFRIFCRNLWYGSQNSIYVSRVKIAGKNSFFLVSFRNFSISERKFLRLLAKKLQEKVKTTFCVSTGTTCGFISF